MASPLLVHVGLNVPTYAFNDFQDQVFFQGILLDPVESLRRFGALYYNVRFGAILPEYPFWRALGPEMGYFAYRWVLASGCGLFLFRSVARHAGPAAGLLAASLFLLSPLTARMLIETYVDLDAVTFSLCALVFLFFRLDRRTVWNGFGAGVLFALAVNANFFAVVLMAAAGLAYLVAYQSRPLRFHVTAIGAGLAGFVFVCLAGFVAYRLFLDVPNLFRPTLEATFRLAGGESATWAEKDRQWLVEWPYIYAPVLLAVEFAAIWGLTRSHLCRGLGAYALACVVFFFAYDAFLHGYSLRLYWYVSFLMPAMVLATLATALAIADVVRPDRRWAVFLPPMLALLAAAALTARGWNPVQGWRVYDVWAAGLAFALALFAVLRFGRAFAAPAAATIHAVAVGFAFVVMCLGWVWSPGGLYSRQREAADWTLFRRINEFAAAMPKQGREPGDMRFLFSSDMPLRQRLIQSAFLTGGYSLFIEPDHTVITLDKLNPLVVAQTSAFHTRFIVLMSADAGQSEAAAGWLRQNGLVVEPWRRFTLPLPETELRVDVLEVKAVGPAPTVRDRAS